MLTPIQGLKNVDSIHEKHMNRVYPIQKFCPDDSNAQYIKDYTEKEISQACNGFKYAEITGNCGQIFCCNNMTKDISFEYNVLSQNPKLEKLCSSSFRATFGSFEDQNGYPLSTLFILTQHDLFNTHQYYGCLHINMIKPERAKKVNGKYSKDLIYAVYFGKNSYEEIPVSKESLSFRIWDFTSDCHQYIHPNHPVPIGQTITNHVRGVALYCPKEYDCNQHLKKSEPNFENPQPIVDLSFRIDKCIDQEIIWNATEIWDDYPQHVGTYECHRKCQSTKIANLAIINEDSCFCASSFNWLPVSMADYFETCSACPDNDNFTCGYKNLYSTVSYVNSSFLMPNSNNFQYWQCVRRSLLNPYNIVLAPELFKVVPWVQHPSECILQHCKDNNFDLAVLSMNENNYFECICLHQDFYKFNMQDLSSACTEVSCRCRLTISLQLIDFSNKNL